MNKELDFLTLEVGSTITRANGFVRNGNFLKSVAESFVPTTSALGNIGIGLFVCIENIEKQGFNTDKAEVFASGSVGGAMKTVIHGICQQSIDSILPVVCSLGCVVIKTSTGKINEYDLEEIEEISPDIVILAGNEEFSQRDLISECAIKLSSIEITAPVVYYGNTAIQGGLEKIFAKSGIKFIGAGDELENNIVKYEKFRKEITELFNRHSVKANGSDRLKAISNHGVHSALDALSASAKLVSETFNNDITLVDVGSVSTSIITNKINSDRQNKSVYGDLGVFLSAPPLIASLNDKEISSKIENVRAVPNGNDQLEITAILRNKALDIALKRYNETYGNVSDIIIGTGGAITRTDGGEKSLKAFCAEDSNVLIDERYIFSSLGCIGSVYPDIVKSTFKRWAECHEKYSKIRDLHFSNC